MEFFLEKNKKNKTDRLLEAERELRLCGQFVSNPLSPEEVFEQELEFFRKKRREAMLVFEVASREAAEVVVGALRFNPKNILEVRTKAVQLQAAEMILDRTVYCSSAEASPQDNAFEPLEIIEGEVLGETKS